jgi:tetratricopeptide (TPR) repeat protein
VNLTARQQLYASLAIDFESVPLNLLDKYNAIAYFLTLADEIADEANNLEKVDGYLQVFKDLCEASAWDKAAQVVSFCPISIELHEQLRIWGYYRQQIELYQKLLGKVNSEQDLVCLYGLGRVFYNLSDFDKSLDYYQQQLELARLVNNRQAEAQALGGLGEIVGVKRNYAEAIAFFQQQLDIAREICDREQEVYALNGLGYSFYSLALNQGNQNYQDKGLNYLEKSLEISHKLNNQELESFCLGSIGDVYLNRGQYDQLLICLLQQLDISERTDDRSNKASALQALGKCYVMLKQLDKALKYSQEALIGFREIGNKYGECITLNSMGVIYCYELKRYQEALPYFEKALEIMQKLDIKANPATVATNIFNCHAYLKNNQQADFYLNMAKTLAAQSDSLEDKGLVTMAIANAYWGRDQIWYKAWGIVLVIKALILIPPWRSVNGRIAMQVAIKQIFGLSS